MDIKTLRSKIDSVDVKVLRLLKRRFKLVKQIGVVKKNLGFEIEDKQREEELFRHLNKISNKLNIDYELIKHIYTLITAESKKLQRKGD